MSRQITVFLIAVRNAYCVW